jgi:hypothetical protein
MVGAASDLLSGGRLDRKAGALPLGITNIEPTGLESAGAQEAHGIVGIDAIWAATVGDDLSSPRQSGRGLVEGGEWDGPCAHDVAGQKLGLRPHIEKHDAPASESVDELRRCELLDVLPLSEVLVGENGHLGHVPRGDVPNGGPELGYALAREPVVDPSPVPARASEAALREQPQMVRGSRRALPRLARDLFDRPLALGQEVDDLSATPARERGGDGRKCVEERGLRVRVRHFIQTIV